MEMKYSREFVALAKNGNFMKTAEDLFMAQSTLSKHIQFLERDCGQKLFYRSTRRVELTRFGKAYLPYAEEMVRLEDKCEAELLSCWDSHLAHIHLGLNHSLNAYEIPTLVHEFRKSHGDCKIEILTANTEMLLNMLKNQACDFVVVREPYSVLQPNQREDFEVTPFFMDPLVLVVPENHRLAGQGSVTFDQLRDEVFVTLPEAIYKICVENCKKYSFEPHIGRMIPSSSDIFDAVSAGCGVAIYGKKRMSIVSSWALKTIDIVPTIHLGIYIVSYKKHVMPNSAKQLIDCLSSKAEV